MIMNFRRSYRKNASRYRPYFSFFLHKPRYKTSYGAKSDAISLQSVIRRPNNYSVLIDPLIACLLLFQKSGNITYNGKKLSDFCVQRTSAYISQTDNHIAELTVRETFDFAARCQGASEGFAGTFASKLSVILL